MAILTVKTPILKQAYEVSGPKKGEPVLLVHGWPDSPRAWDKILPSLHRAGYQTVVPYLRGYGPTSFRDPLFGRKRRRTGQPVALALDMVHLADRLGMKRFHYIGHDWGAHTGYALAALFPNRLKSLTALAVAFKPGKAQPPPFPQARAYWYQWLLCTRPGEETFRTDRVAYGKAQWDSWSPAGWYEEADLAEAAKSWKNPDFADVALHYYRSRWGHAEPELALAPLQNRFEQTKTLTTPTILLHGREDSCLLTETTNGSDRYFANSYRRFLLTGVGHFPQRENPGFTAGLILEHLRTNA